MNDILEKQIVAERPNVNFNQAVDVYAPIADYDNAGLAKYYNEHFIVEDGLVKLRRGNKGDKGDTGAKILKTDFVGVDEEGNKVYRQYFDNGVTNDFVIPKGPEIKFSRFF